jgi:hypothetical protein
VKHGRREFARVVVLGGFTITALGATVNFLSLAENGTLKESAKADIQLVAVWIAAFISIAAWWFITKLSAENRVQLSLLRKAYGFLALQGLLSSLTYVLIDLSWDVTSWPDAVFWLYGIGGVVTGIGFVLMMFTCGGVDNPIQHDDLEVRPTLE